MALDWTLDLVFSKDLVQFLDIKAPMGAHLNESVANEPATKVAVAGN